jgi:hypothetical protein
VEFSFHSTTAVFRPRDGADNGKDTGTALRRAPALEVWSCTGTNESLILDLVGLINLRWAAVVWQRRSNVESISADWTTKAADEVADPRDLPD